MSHVEFNKWPSRPVEFKGQRPHPQGLSACMALAFDWRSLTLIYNSRQVMFGWDGHREVRKRMATLPELYAVLDMDYPSLASSGDVDNKPFGSGCVSWDCTYRM